MPGLTTLKKMVDRAIRKSTLTVGMALIAATALSTTTLSAAPYNLAWTRQLGTSRDDRSTSVAVDGAGNVFISGITEGGIGGEYEPGGRRCVSHQVCE